MATTKKTTTKATKAKTATKSATKTGTKTPKGEKKPYRLIKLKNGRYSITKLGKTINGLEKIKILLAEGLIKTGLPKAKEEAAAES